MASLVLLENVARLVEQVERTWLDTLIRLQEANRQLQELRREVENTRNSSGWRVARGINVAVLKMLRLLRGR